MDGLALALACSGFAGGLLSGVWLGFKVVSRDAGLVGQLDRRVAQSLTASSEAKARADALDATWADYLAEIDRKRNKAATERQRADQAVAKAAEAQADAPPADADGELSPRDRRRALARRLRSVG